MTLPQKHDKAQCNPRSLLLLHIDPVGKSHPIHNTNADEKIVPSEGEHSGILDLIDGVCLFRLYLLWVPGDFSSCSVEPLLGV